MLMTPKDLVLELIIRHLNVLLQKLDNIQILVVMKHYLLKPMAAIEKNYKKLHYDILDILTGQKHFSLLTWYLAG